MQVGGEEAVDITTLLLAPDSTAWRRSKRYTVQKAWQGIYSQFSIPKKQGIFFILDF